MIAERQHVVALVACKSQMILAINRNHVQKDPTLDCVAQTVAGQDLSALHEVIPFVQGRFKASRVLRERRREHDGL